AIETSTVPNALSIPLEAVSIDGTTPYVYRKDGSRVVRQQIETGVMNDDDVVVSRGLSEGDEVLLSIPANASELPVVHLAGASPPHAVPQPTDRPAGTAITPARPDSSVR